MGHFHPLGSWIFVDTIATVALLFLLGLLLLGFSLGLIVVKKLFQEMAQLF